MANETLGSLKNLPTNMKHTHRFATAVILLECGTFEAMLVRIRLFANRIPQSRSVMNLVFGLDNFSVRCEINFLKALPVVDKILSFMWTSLCTILFR